jgi:hypothetical protein
MFLRLLLVAALCLPGQDRDDVDLTEDFESFDNKNWNDFGAAPEALEIVDGGRAGKCAQITATLGKNTGAHLYKMLNPGLDTSHLRFHVKFEKERLHPPLRPSRRLQPRDEVAAGRRRGAARRRQALLQRHRAVGQLGQTPRARRVELLLVLVRDEEVA